MADTTKKSTTKKEETTNKSKKEEEKKKSTTSKKQKKEEEEENNSSSDEDEGRIAKLLKAAMAADLDSAEVDDDMTYEEYKQREIEKMKAEGWVVEGEAPPAGSNSGSSGGPPKKPAPPPPPRTSLPGIFSKVDYDTSHMWNQDLSRQQEEQLEENQEEEIHVDFTGTKVAEKYEILEQIGSGVSSVIRRIKLKGGEEEFALKVITPETNTLVSNSWKSTAKNLKACQHPRVVKLVEEFQEGDNLYLVLERLPGTAVSVLRKSGAPWTQKDACRVLTQVFEAVVHIHSKGLTHGDLSPGTILAVDSQVSAIKVGGFCKCNSQDTEEDLFCEASFKAPEVVERKKHGQAVDMWAVGCLAFLFLSGKLPFKDSNVMRLNQNIRKGTYTFDEADWAGIDEKAKELVKSLLAVDPSARLTAAKALEHPWIKSGGSDSVIKNFTANLQATFN